MARLFFYFPFVAALLIGCMPAKDRDDTPVPVSHRITALDATHLVVQIDPTIAEHAAFRPPSSLETLGGWKRDRAFDHAAAAVQADRAEVMRLGRAGTGAAVVRADGRLPAVCGYFPSFLGQSRYPDGKGGALPVRAAEILHHFFLTFDKPLISNETVTVVLPTGEKYPFTYDPMQPSPLFKVNQVGYVPEADAKYAYLGGWLGTSGPYPLSDAVLRSGFELVETATGHVVFNGPIVRRMPDPTTRKETPFTGEEVAELDFSAFSKPGNYFIRIPGLGRSRNFRISSDAMADAFAVHMHGLFNKRCGCDKREPFTHWTDKPCHTNVIRGTFPPDFNDYGLHKTAAVGFSDTDGHPLRLRHFDVIRLNQPANPERLNLPGGWHDAADYDRRPYHLMIVGDLAAVYLARPDNFFDGQLNIPEKGNGVPDILDEAAWGLRHLLRGQCADGGVGTWVETIAHPGEYGEMPSEDHNTYYLSRPTRASSLEYAAYAALLARTHPVLRERFLPSALRAWTYATNTAPVAPVAFTVPKKIGRPETQTAFWREGTNLPPLYVVKAAANLAAVTGDRSYLTLLEDPSFKDRFVADFNKNAWGWRPFCLLELECGDCPETRFYRDLRRKKIVREADVRLKQLEEGYPYRTPWFGPRAGWVHTMSWGASHPLVRSMMFIAAHVVTGNRKYLDAARLAVDFHNGCNPSGATLTSGLGAVYPVRFLDLQSASDGIAEYVPGITPYRWTFGIPARAASFVFHDDKSLMNQWPIWRRWPDVEVQTVAASEYTVWETIAPPAAVTGYLLTPSRYVSPPHSNACSNVRNLLGYWCLP